MTKYRCILCRGTGELEPEAGRLQDDYGVWHDVIMTPVCYRCDGTGDLAEKVADIGIAVVRVSSRLRLVGAIEASDRVDEGLSALMRAIRGNDPDAPGVIAIREEPLTGEAFVATVAAASGEEG